MSELVNGLQLTQNFAHPKNPGVKHFFDSTDVYWADVIVNMLSRKLNILCIENQDYPEYLRNHAVEELMEVSTS